MTSDSLVRSYLWGTDLSGTLQGAGGVGGLLAIRQKERTVTDQLVCIDGNGNIMALVDAALSTSAAIKARYTYDAFGQKNRAYGVFAATNPFGFSSKYEDSETGLLYYGYRFYDPAGGRWLSRDPIGEEGGLNMYGFVGNNAINGVDVLGLDRHEINQRHTDVRNLRERGRHKLADAIERGPIRPLPPLPPRVQGVVQVAGGVLQIGVGAVAAPETLGGSLVLIWFGCDNVITGASMVINGAPQRSVTNITLTGATVKLTGLDQSTVQPWVDVGLVGIEVAATGRPAMAASSTFRIPANAKVIEYQGNKAVVAYSAETIDPATVRFSQIRKSWNEFYRNNPSPTQQQLLDHATTIDEQFGYLFNPPVGSVR